MGLNCREQTLNEEVSALISMYPHFAHPHNVRSGSIGNKEKQEKMVKQYGSRGACRKGLDGRFKLSSCPDLVRSSAYSGMVILGMAKLAGSMSDEYVCR